MNSIRQSNNTIKIIIIDDDPDWCTLIKIMVQGLGHVIDAATTPEEAYAKIEQAQMDGSPYQVAIVDMAFNIGVSNNSLGKEIMRTIKDKHPQIACILSSGQPFSPSDILDLRDEYGLDYYLVKHNAERSTLDHAIKRAMKVNGMLGRSK